MLTTWLPKPVWLMPKTRTKTIELRFSLPAAEARATPPSFYTSKFKQSLADMSETPIEQIRLLRREFKNLNRSHLGMTDRLDRTRQGLNLFLPLLQETLRKFSREGGIPDSALRRDALDLSAEILHMLGESYLAAFKQIYEQPDAAFDLALAQARHCACRVLETLRLEQRVRALRYQVLGGAAWHMANSVFHIMRAYDSVDAPIPLLESDVYAMHAGRTTCLSAVYSALQLTGRFDMLRWPVAFQALLAGYLDSTVDLVSIRDDDGGKLASGHLLAYCHDEQPAAAQRLAPEDAPADAPVALLIDWTRLMARVRDDCTALMKASRTGNPGSAPVKLRLLSSLESLALAQMLLTSMQRPDQAEALHERAERVLGMQMYVSFREVYLLLGHILSHPGEELGKRFIDHFAERSAMIAKDHTTEAESLWYVLGQNRALIRLKTEESEFTTAMAVGDLVSYALGEADKHRPRLAVVKRLYRSSAGNVVIDLGRLAKYAEPVVVAPAGQDRNNAKADVMYGLLMFDPDLGCNLLISPKANVMDKSEVVMTFRNRDYPLALGGLKYVTRGFYLFHMPVRMSTFGLETPPEYPEAIAVTERLPLQ
jgi:hypothetical protein